MAGEKRPCADHVGHYLSPLGPITLSGGDGGLTGLWFDGQKHFGETLPSHFDPCPHPALDEAKRWLDIYFGGAEPSFTPRLCLRASPFRLAVWEALMALPYGKTVSYGGIAAAVGARTGRTVCARAVGGAVGRNPISLIIPCHRVVGADGALTGYAGGEEKKRFLLELEKKGAALAG